MTIFESDQYDKKSIYRYGGFLLLMVFLCKATAGLSMMAVALFAVLSLVQKRPIWLMYLVLFMTISSAGNRAIFGTNAISVLTVRATLVTMTFLVAGQAFNVRASRAQMFFWGILPYIGWEAVSSLQGFQPIVSYLKLTLFTCLFLAMFGVANTVNASSRVNAKILRSAILTIVALMTLGSVAIIPLPGLSLMAPDEATMLKMMSGEITNLFCGMCSHSQAMGPMAGVLGTFLFADLVFSIKKWDKFYLVMLFSCLLVCYKTSSRTGMGTMLAGFGLVTFIIVQSRGMGARWKQRVVSAMSVIVILGAVAIVALPSMRDHVTKFALKWGGDKRGEQVTVENVFASRQGKIDSAMINFKKKPFIGNGFQVSEEMQFEKREGFLSYIAAPIEKGVWIYAVLEEGGVPGFLLFSGWLLILFPMLIKRHAYVMASTFFAFIMANVGEFSIFAMTYVGGFYWTLTFAAGCLDVQRMKGQDIQVYNVPLPVVIEEVGLDAWTKRLG